jgi:hypothetical protein
MIFLVSFFLQAKSRTHVTMNLSHIVKLKDEQRVRRNTFLDDLSLSVNLIRSCALKHKRYVMTFMINVYLSIFAE